MLFDGKTHFGGSQLNSLRTGVHRLLETPLGEAEVLVEILAVSTLTIGWLLKNMRNCDDFGIGGR